jgi:hypothetical protein
VARINDSAGYLHFFRLRHTTKSGGTNSAAGSNCGSVGAGNRQTTEAPKEETYDTDCQRRIVSITVGAAVSGYGHETYDVSVENFKKMYPMYPSIYDQPTIDEVVTAKMQSGDMFDLTWVIRFTWICVNPGKSSFG